VTIEEAEARSPSRATWRLGQYAAGHALVLVGYRDMLASGAKVATMTPCFFRAALTDATSGTAI
jgi:hypothetical protein